MVKGAPLTVVVSGYYGFDNAGDEALLEALLDEWRRLRPLTRFIVLSGNPDRTAARHRVEAIGRTDVGALWAALKKADVFVSGGGSLLQDATSPRTVPYYTAVMAMARLRRVPVVVYSQGVGPLRRPLLRRIAGRGLRRAHLVMLRDEASAREAEALGVPREAVVVTADPVFARARIGEAAPTRIEGADRALSREPTPAPPAGSTSIPAPGSTSAATAGSTSTPAPGSASAPAAGPTSASAPTAHPNVVPHLPPGPVVGVSLRPLQGGDSGAAGPSFVAALARAFGPFLDRHGAKLLPLPLFPAQDEPVLRSLMEHLGPDRLAAWPLDAPPEQLTLDQWIGLLQSVDLCVTMRLHGLIFAAAAAAPFLALADDPKVDAHGAELGLDPETCIVKARSLDEQTFVAALETAWEQREENRSALRRSVPTLAARARRAAELAIEAAEGSGAAMPGRATGMRARPTAMQARRTAMRARPTEYPASDRVVVLDTAFDPVTMAEATERVARWIENGSPDRPFEGPGHIVTANPEIVMRARQDAAVEKVLAEADLVVADGIGIVAAARLLGTPVPERVPGVELTEALLERAAEGGWRVFLLGGAPGVAEAAAENIRRRRPSTCIVGVRDGYFAKEEEAQVAAEVAAARPDIVFVAMGAPRQELFIADHRRTWRHIPAAIGVGGSIDVLAGKVNRAPEIWQKLGLEWLYRVVRQPSRFGRALVLPRFAWLVLLRALRRNLL